MVVSKGLKKAGCSVDKWVAWTAVLTVWLLAAQRDASWVVVKAVQ
jgi:hypothetical protein